MASSNVQQQLGGKYLAQQTQSNRLSRGGNVKLANKVDSKESKCMRNNYLECDLEGSPDKESRKRLSANIESGSHSPVEGILNPLSSQPLLSKTSIN